MAHKNKSHGSGEFLREKIRKCPDSVVIENGVLLFHPENISLGNNVYVGHNTILKGYWKNEMVIGDNCWIGQMCFFHAAGGITIGKNVGIGPCVKILTSTHADELAGIPIIENPVKFDPVIIEDDCDIGIGAIIMPGVIIGEGSQIGAGAVVTKSVAPYSVAAGVPANVIRNRSKKC
jgi:acetyltransferase-like isoleucine patch superfamily enzyme